MSLPRPGSLQTSYSTNDVPTIKNTLGFENVITPPKTSAEQQFHNHNVNMGRIPANGFSNRQSRELSSTLGALTLKTDDKTIAAMHSNLQASAPPFGPPSSAGTDSNHGVVSPPMSFSSPQGYGFNMQSYNVNQMNHLATNAALQGYQSPSQGVYAQFTGYGQFAKGQESSTRAARRMNNGDDSRFNNVPLESYRGSLYELCKDQHGCRYLQRKLEDGNAEHIEAVFQETCPFIVELMTGKYGARLGSTSR